LFDVLHIPLLNVGRRERKILADNLLLNPSEIKKFAVGEEFREVDGFAGLCDRNASRPRRASIGTLSVEQSVCAPFRGTPGGVKHSLVREQARSHAHAEMSREIPDWSPRTTFVTAVEVTDRAIAIQTKRLKKNVQAIGVCEDGRSNCVVLQVREILQP
jgi:hypothetical protein